MDTAYTNSLSRVWFQEGGPGPANRPIYYGTWKAGAPSWDMGDITRIRVPDPDRYGSFVRAGSYRGEPGDPELSITARYTLDRSTLLRAARANCAHTLHIHMGQCENPQDFARGWKKSLLLEEAEITNWSAEDIGALGPDETAAVNEEVPFTGSDLYEVMPINLTELAGATITREITSVYVCDRQQCGECGASSDGCQVILALEGGISASPGLPPRVHYTVNGGGTWATRTVTTLAANQAGSRVFCSGSYTVVISADDNAHHYILTSDLVAASGSWTEVTTGYGTTAQAPLAAWSLGGTETWLVGEGGYIYFMGDPTSGVTQNSAGTTTTQNLNDVHFSDSDHGVAVGASNTVVFTTNGGDSWVSVTGPAVGIVLNAVWMVSQTAWFVGAANGSLYYTLNSGVTWTEKVFPGSGTGQVRDIVFTTPSVGYLAHSTSTPGGRIFRTLDGGYSWYLLPEGSGSIPANDYVSSLAVCDDPNIVFGGGLGDNATDGFLVKGA